MTEFNISRSGQIKGKTHGICCFYSMYAVRNEQEQRLVARNRNIVSEWSDMSTRGLMLQRASSTKIQQSVFDLIQIGHHHRLIEMQLVLAMLQLKYFSLGIKQQSPTNLFQDNKCIQIKINSQRNMFNRKSFFFSLLFFQNKTIFGLDSLHIQRLHTLRIH